MNTLKYKKGYGFTLIELLVVIAIIGMLSSVILASLNSARNKGKDATVKQELADVRPQAQLVYEAANASYSGVCINAQVILMLQTASQASQGNTSSYVCNAGPPINSTVWAAQVPLTTSGQYWCADWTGSSKSELAALGVNTTCP